MIAGIEVKGINHKFRQRHGVEHEQTVETHVKMLTAWKTWKSLAILQGYQNNCRILRPTLGYQKLSQDIFTSLETICDFWPVWDLTKLTKHLGLLATNHRKLHSSGPRESLWIFLGSMGNTSEYFWTHGKWKRMVHESKLSNLMVNRNALGESMVELLVEPVPVVGLNNNPHQPTVLLRHIGHIGNNLH